MKATRAFVFRNNYNRNEFIKDAIKDDEFAVEFCGDGRSHFLTVMSCDFPDSTTKEKQAEAWDELFGVYCHWEYKNFHAVGA